MQTATISERRVELVEKNRPQQQRAIKTYEAILAATGELLREVGLERISTNIIAERAGVTVPALYRYFPNKYAVLNALGSRLLGARKAVFERWQQDRLEGHGPYAMLESLSELLLGVYRVTRDFPGGVELLHGMQAMAPLQKVQQDNEWMLARNFAGIWAELNRVQCTEELVIKSRVAVAMGFASIQVALEDPSVVPEVAVQEGASALRAYLEHGMMKGAREVN
jgi:AcrR family transcriptional regulator